MEKAPDLKLQALRDAFHTLALLLPACEGGRMLRRWSETE